MYENETYEAILEKVLARVSDTVDKRQGSIIYDALAPACAELAQMYIELDNVLKLAFAYSSSGEYLEKRCEEIGIKRKEATKAIRKGIFTGVNPPINSRFSLNDLTYKVIDNSEGMNNVQLECEQVGSKGNDYIGILMPITEIPGLESAELNDILVPGEDEETDEELLSRFNAKIQTPSTSGNVYHYLEWVNEIYGVGAARVLPLWNGENTVKILIVDSNIQPASSELVSEVQEYLDPNSEGLGYGVAPIGCYCTVAAPVGLNINVTADISNTTESKVKPIFEEKLKEYLTDTIKKYWHSKATITISYAQIGVFLLESVVEAGGTDYINLLVNGGTQNIQFSDNIPVVGTVTLNAS